MEAAGSLTSYKSKTFMATTKRISTLTPSMLFQGVLLHPDGEVRKTGRQRRHQERRRPARWRGLRDIPGPQPSL